MTKKLLRVTVMLGLTLLAQFAHAESNALPADAAKALHSGRSAVLYSLEPWSDPERNVARLDGFEILGQATLSPTQKSTVISAFDVAIARYDGVFAACFDPRHAVRILFNGQAYDFLLCYSCQQLEVYRDGKLLKSVGAAGSPKVLNGLLTSLNIPLSHSFEDMQTRQALEEKKSDEAEQQWLRIVPATIRQTWNTDPQFRMGVNPSGKKLKEMEHALEVEIPNSDERI